MIKAKCTYIVYPKKSNYEPDEFIVAQCTTDAQNVPTVYRNGKRKITFRAKGKGIHTDRQFDVMLDGKWNFDEKYGLTLSVTSADIVIPSDKDGIIAYLVKFVDGCGKKTAEKIYDKFGSATIMILNDCPSKLLEVEGMRERKAKRMVKSYKSTRHLSELSYLLAPFNLSKSTIEFVYDVLGEDAVPLIKEDPFILQKFRGFSYSKLDEMSVRLNCKPDNPNRIKAALKECIRLAKVGSHIYKYESLVQGRNLNNTHIYEQQNLIQGGNMYVNQFLLHLATFNLLNERRNSCVTAEQITAVMWEMKKNSELLGENGNVYLPNDFANEQKTARFISEMLIDSKVKRHNDDAETEKVICAVEEKIGIEFSKNQKEAIKMVLANPLSIITGGAGTGKTTVLKAVLESLIELEGKSLNIVLAAPTGKAAIRMTASTGYPAQTLHKTLGLVTEKDYYVSEEEIETLDADIIVCDEFSMADQNLAYRLFATVNRKKTRVILIGDVGQLPSVGAGKVLNDIIDSNVVPTTALNVIFRQAQTSNIVRNSSNIYRGVHFIDYSKDFLIYESTNIEEISNKVVDEYLKAVAEYGMDDVCILTPIRKNGQLCTNALNSRIQSVMNPLNENSNERVVNGVHFRVGDKVMQMKNITIDSDTENKVMICNGDTGYITKIKKSTDGFVFGIRFDGNRYFEYSEDDMHNVDLAYSITIHKSQGSEYKAVIMPLHQYMPDNLMTRNLIYTGVTRAKKVLHIIGDKKLIDRAIDNNIANNRNTMLAEKIKGYYNDFSA